MDNKTNGDDQPQSTEADFAKVARQKPLRSYL